MRKSPRHLRSKPLRFALDEFTDAMQDRLAQKERQHFTGWDDEVQVPDDELYFRIEKNIQAHVAHSFQGDKTKSLVDAANMIMFLYYRTMREKEERLREEGAKP